MAKKRFNIKYNMILNTINTSGFIYIIYLNILNFQYYFENDNLIFLVRLYVC